MLRLGLIGNPVSKSLSPQIFKILSQISQTPLTYDLIESNDLKEVTWANYDGLNITIPLKENILNFKEFNSTADVTRTGASNLWRASDQSLHNTDIEGVKRALGKSGSSWAALVIGAGGAARAALVALERMGVTVVSVVNRSPERILELKKSFAVVPPEGVEFDLLIKATPELPLDLAKGPWWELLSEGATVFDMSYRPEMTLFLEEAQRRGCRTVSGLDMLVWQAIAGFEIWSGRDMRDHYPEVRRQICGI